MVDPLLRARLRNNCLRLELEPWGLQSSYFYCHAIQFPVAKGYCTARSIKLMISMRKWQRDVFLFRKTSNCAEKNRIFKEVDNTWGFWIKLVLVITWRWIECATNSTVFILPANWWISSYFLQSEKFDFDLFVTSWKIREEIKRVIRQVTFISLTTGKTNELRR